MSKTIYLTDRTAEETDELCRMKFWWHNCHGERGIVPVEDAPALRLGGELHADMEMFGKGASVEEVSSSISIPDNPTQTQLEEVYRRLGWVAAWGAYYEPFLRANFDEVDCEAEIVLDRDPLWVGVIPDRVQRSRVTGRLVYREWKSTASTRSEWQAHWQYAMQIHLGLMALEEEMGEQVDFGQVTGFYKGVDRSGRLAHPYVWGYSRGDEWSTTYKYGWDHRPVWEYGGGVVEWVERCGKEIAESQFVWSAPVMLDRRKVESWVKVRVDRHQQIEAVKDRAQTDIAFRELVFPPSAIHCRPPYGSPCPYLQACYNYSTQVDPIGSGQYVARVPHHNLEVVGIK